MKEKRYKREYLLEKEIAVQLINVSKKYEIHHEKPTLVEKFVNRQSEVFWALKDINLVIKKGEKLGIVGHNGSGKTTLLKIIARITTPTIGSVTTYGKVVSLIDLSAGFHMDLTGYQNIYLSGLLLGMKRDEVNRRINDIISFADIKQFIDIPIFTYSQGMLLRLGFAIAVHLDPDILILDENITAGDQDFQKKSLEKINSFFKKGKTIIIVSHWMEFMKKNCQRMIKIENGSLSKLPYET